jgi:hypothetical protein
MAKALKTAAELTALINAELSKHEVCIHFVSKTWRREDRMPGTIR